MKPTHERPDGARALSKHATETANSSGFPRWLRSRRTAITFLMLFAVVAWAKPMGLLLWARIRILTSLPKTAIADDPVLAHDAPEAPIAPPEFDPGLSKIPEVRTDPFRIDPYTFPKANPPEVVAPVPEPTPKPSVPSVDEAKREMSRTAGRAAERFRLQSAGRGLSMAVIDGRTYRVGDPLDGADGLRFTLVEVLEGAAIVEWEGERFELRLRSAAGQSVPTQGSPAKGSSSGGGTRE
ncbi:MAG: hypothetical protein ACKO3W_15525 [bacterium]